MLVYKMPLAQGGLVAVTKMTLGQFRFSIDDRKNGNKLSCRKCIR